MGLNKHKDTLLIGVAGKAGSGKTTVADHLIHKHHFAEFNFADNLKAAAGYIFGLTEEQMYDPVKKEEVDEFWNMTPRKILQLMGTEAMRHTFGPDIWTESITRTINQFWTDINAIYPSAQRDIVIADTRFENEAQWIKSNGGYVIQLYRKTPSTLSEDSQQHASEQLLPEDYIDCHLNNNGSIQQLCEKVDDFIGGL